MTGRWSAGLLAGALMLANSASGHASQLVEASYRIALDRVEIGRANLRADIGPADYSVTVESAFRILLVWSADIVASTRGAVVADRLAPERYRMTYDGWRDFEISVDFAGGDIERIDVQPPPDEEDYGERVPLEAQHLRAVIDPLSALLARAPHSALPLPPALCDTLLPIFSGFSRFDLAVRAPRADVDQPAAANRLVCGFRYRPIAGHRADSKEIPRLAADDSLSVELAAVGGTDVFLLSRLHIPTSIGTVKIERDDTRE